MNKIPENIAAEIAQKRTLDAEGEIKNEDSVIETEDKKDVTVTKKPNEAAKPKNGQSIAQVAEAANDEEDEEDEDEDTHDSDSKPNRKRSNLFREFMDVKKELKDTKRINKQTSQQYTELAEAMQELIGVVKNLKGSDAQRDEIEDFADEWGLDKEGTKALVNILEKRLSKQLKPKEKNTKVDDEDDEEEDEKPKKNKVSASELKARQIELAIEGEYDEYIDSYPGLEGKLNLKAIKRYIMGDEENIQKSFHNIINEMYPGILKNKVGIDGGDDGDNKRNDDEKINWNDKNILERLDKDPNLQNKYHDDLINRVKSMRR